MVNNRIGEFIVPFIVLRFDKLSKVVVINEDGAINRYSTSQIRPFLEKPSMLDNSIMEYKIEDRHNKTYKATDKPEFDG